MGWAHEWADKLQSGLYYDLLSKGFFDKKPDALEPDISGLGAYLEAFQELSSCRSIGMEMGPIPFTALVEYYRIYPIGGFEEFHYVIRKMDNTVLDSLAKKAKAKEGTGSGSNNSNPPNKHSRSK